MSEARFGNGLRVGGNQMLSPWGEVEGSMEGIKFDNCSLLAAGDNEIYSNSDDVTRAKGQ
jgi:hypothetical protein